jgi:hypothetical protein
MLLFLFGLALGNPYEGQPTDVVADAALRSSTQRVFLYLSDVRRYGHLYPSDCGKKFATSADPNGEGAATRFVHKTGPLSRRIVAVISRVEEHRLVEIDHGGARGFITRFTIEEVGEGSAVTMTSYQNMPPWPVRGVYFNQVQPAWQGCQQRMLANLQQKLAEQ